MSHICDKIPQAFRFMGSRFKGHACPFNKYLNLNGVRPLICNAAGNNNHNIRSMIIRKCNA